MRLERFFRFIGVDWRRFTALLAVSIRIDFRGSWSRSQQKRKFSPILRSAIFYTMMGGWMAVSLASHASPFMYAFLMLSYSMVMMAFAVLLEFGNAIINPEDAEILLFRPIDSRTYFVAKLCNLLFYVGLMGSALILLPTVIGGFVGGSTWTFPVIFFPAALCANTAAAAFIVLIYTALLRVLPHQKFKDIIAYLQIGFVFILFFTYQLIPRMSQDGLPAAIDGAKSWLFAMPSAWYAGLVLWVSGAGGPDTMILGIAALGVTLFLCVFAFRKISLQYAGHIARLQTEVSTRDKVRTEDSPVRDFRTGIIDRIFRKPEIKAGYRLVSCMIRRDRNVKLGIYPLLGLPLMFLVISIMEGEFRDPFAISERIWSQNLADFSVLFIFYMIFNLMVGITYAREWEAAWVFHGAPLASPARFYSGVKAALFIRLVLPFYIILGIIHCVRIPPLHGFQHVLTLFWTGMAVLAAVSFFIKDYPFSKKGQRGARAQRFATLLLVTPFFVFVGVVQVFVYSMPGGWWVLQGFLIILYAVLESAGSKRLDRVLRETEFF